MLKKLKILIAGCATIFLLTSCTGGDSVSMDNNINSLQSFKEYQWESLAQRKIYFGHQSVGFNIMEGLNDLMRENKSIKLNIIETSDRRSMQTGAFAHSRVGNNEDPHSKTVAFEKLLDDGLGDACDTAFFKFCYVDINSETDIQDVFSSYKNTMKRLKEEYPHIRFIHTTVPLGASRSNWKVTIKKILGKEIWAYEQNIARNRYNDLLREEYAGKEPIFDLAQVESTYPDGTRSTFEKDDKVYFSMVPDYTYDHGHLNEKGRRMVAQELLNVLISLE